MPTIIDALLVTLGLDASGFEKGQKQAQEGLQKTGAEAEKQRKLHEEQAKKTAQAYNTVRDSIMGVAAAVVTAVAGGEFLSYLNKNDAAAGRLAVNLGATARQVSILEGVWKRLGSTSGDADSFLRNTNKILEEIKLTGTSGALLPLAQAGLNVGAFRDAKSPQERAAMLAQVTKGLTPQDAQFRLQAAGYSEDTVGVLIRNADALDDVFRSQEKLNALQDGDSERAIARNRAAEEFNQRLENLGRTINRSVSPALTVMYDGLGKVIDFLAKDGPTAISVIALLSGATLTLAGSMGVLGTATSALMLRLGPLVATAASLYEVARLIHAIGEYVDVKTRGSVEDAMTPGLKARIAAGALNGAADPFHSGGTASAGSGSLGSRNNNPGNLRLAGQVGATAGAGGFAAFGSMADGLAALDTQLSLDANRGMTLAQMIAKYAPAGDGNNVAAYITDVAKRTGLNPNSRPNTNDPATMRALMGAFTTHEGNPVDIASINAGMDLAQSRGRGTGTGGVNIGNLTVTTTASTMTGTGKDLGDAINQRYILAQQANAGPQ